VGDGLAHHHLVITHCLVSACGGCTEHTRCRLKVL